ncbi:hypothetical protein PTW37_03125 [Arthrobacter agilis]|uniref:hypothetical protein n=1 Tax=Arthrobacter agilis TaxID=37921 RepID=UPI002366A63C|nr:hypothetical protein [Arthrobacter agilis]WDF33930.1 hypothetical protein PTW37_03125 [Arthrobacter agilis]
MQPIMDKAAFSRLVAETGSTRAATSFISRFADMLDERIIAIEQAFRAPHPGQWQQTVRKLHADAGVAGAARIHATAGQLLELDPQDTGIAPTLIGQLRSDARVFTLAHSALCEEQAFADLLATRRHA